MQQQEQLTPRRKWRSMFSPGLVPRQKSMSSIVQPQQQQQQQSDEGDTTTTTQEDSSSATESPDSPQQHTKKKKWASSSSLIVLPPTSTTAPLLLASSPAEDPAADLARYWPRPPHAMTAWRERAAARATTSVVKLSALMRAMHLCKWSVSKHRAAAVTLYILLMVSCPDMADAQVVALAVQYLDRYMVASTNSFDSSSSSSSKNYFHVAAACMALALKWERQDAGQDLASAPAGFNRLLELFQGGGVLTLAALGRLEQDVCVCLEFDMWTCTPAEWLCLVRDAGPMAACTDGDATTYPPLCWLRREPCAPGADPLPRLEETAAALARLPLEEQLLLHALRRPELVGWAPVRLGAACLVAAGRCGPARCEAARLCTTTITTATASSSAESMLDAVRCHRATSKDATALVGLMQRPPAWSSGSIHARVPSPPPLPPSPPSFFLFSSSS